MIWTTCSVCSLTIPKNSLKHMQGYCTGCRKFVVDSLTGRITYFCPELAHCSISTVDHKCKACWMDRCLVVGALEAVCQSPGISKADGQYQQQLVNRRNYLNHVVLMYPERVHPDLVSTYHSHYFAQLTEVGSRMEMMRISSHRPDMAYFGKSVQLLLEDDNNELANLQSIRGKLVGHCKKPGFLHFDLLLHLELVKCYNILQCMTPSEQESQIKHVLLTATIFSQAFYSWKICSQKLVLPNGLVPSEIPLGPENWSSNELRSFQRTAYRLSMAPLLKLESISMEESILVKLIILFKSGAPGLSSVHSKRLEWMENQFKALLKRHLSQSHGCADGTSKFVVLMDLIESIFEVTTCMLIYHRLVRLYFGKQQYECPVYESIMHIYVFEINKVIICGLKEGQNEMCISKSQEDQGKVLSNRPLRDHSGGHLNNSETVDDILKAIGKNDQSFFRDVVLLKGINAVVANNLSQQANVTSNELSSSLPDSGQFGELNQEDERYLFAILKSLATAYRDTFKQDYGIVKEIHVIPIAEYSITDINPVVKRCVVGVLHKVDGRLSGIAALLVNFTMPVVG
uniref:Nuclear receptor domain-containing protein n=1 Tax=Ditylenchus dipsaci TaxID=166011 RepID=A0A915DZH2_9BILA